MGQSPYLPDVSPLMYVRNVETPVMIIHSENLRCPVEQAEEWFSRQEDRQDSGVCSSRQNTLSQSKPKHRIERLEFIWLVRQYLAQNETTGGIKRPAAGCRPA